MSENEKSDDDSKIAETFIAADEELEKEKQKSLRLLADYQNLQKQNIDRINLHGDKIISDFLIVYEDLIRLMLLLMDSDLFPPVFLFLKKYHHPFRFQTLFPLIF